MHKYRIKIPGESSLMFYTESWMLLAGQPILVTAC